jgi:hypothetical protein
VDDLHRLHLSSGRMGPAYWHACDGSNGRAQPRCVVVSILNNPIYLSRGMAIPDVAVILLTAMRPAWR